MAEVKMKSSKQEGAVYISSTGLTWGNADSTKDKPSAEKLKKLKENVYGRGISEKQKRLIFTDRFTIIVTNEKGDEDPEISKKMMKMTRKTVDLWPKMKQAYDDTFWMGTGFFNPVWKYGDGEEYPTNEYYLSQLRRLPPESFADAPSEGDQSKVYSEILKGVTLDDEKQPVYYQTDDEGNSTQIKNIFIVRDPTAGDLAGDPIILPLTRVMVMLDYTWLTQMQKVNRTGSPIMFIRIDPGHPEAQPDDNAYAQKVLENWGKNTAFALRPNMELITTNISDTADNLETIAALHALIIDYFSPSKFVSKDGSLIGGSSAPEIELLQSYIRGIHSWIEDAFAALLRTYLTANGYKGYDLEVKIPTPSIDRSELDLKAVDTGFKTKTISLEERRKHLPIELEPLTDELRQEIADEYAGMDTNVPGMMTFTPKEDATKGPGATDEKIKESEDEKDEQTQKVNSAQSIQSIEDEETKALTRIVIATEKSIMNALRHLEEE